MAHKKGHAEEKHAALDYHPQTNRPPEINHRRLARIFKVSWGGLFLGLEIPWNIFLNANYRIFYPRHPRLITSNSDRLPPSLVLRRGGDTAPSQHFLVLF